MDACTSLDVKLFHASHFVCKNSLSYQNVVLSDFLVFVSVRSKVETNIFSNSNDKKQFEP